VQGFMTEEQVYGSIATLRRNRPIPKPLDHGFEQAALNRVVIDDKHDVGHVLSKTGRRVCRFGAMSLVSLNGLLNGTNGFDAGGAVAGPPPLAYGENPLPVIATPRIRT
jgi:hypothetical protein